MEQKVFLQNKKKLDKSLFNSTPPHVTTHGIKNQGFPNFWMELF